MKRKNNEFYTKTFFYVNSGHHNSSNNILYYTIKMAFDRPLEADRVDDLGLLSTFVRAPIVGPIMWIGTAILGRRVQVADGDKENQLIQPTVASKRDANTNNALHSSCENDCFPDMSSSTISDIMDSALIQDECSSRHNQRLTVEECKVNKTYNSSKHKKKLRKTSWSDESGQSLVEYYDMVSSCFIVIVHRYCGVGVHGCSVASLLLGVLLTVYVSSSSSY